MKKLLLGGTGLVVALVAAVFVWFNFIRDDAPAAFELTDQTETAAEESSEQDPPVTPLEEDTDDGAAEPSDGETVEQDTADGDDAGGESTGGESTGGDDAGDAEAGALTGLDGTWTVGTGSEAGYRVVEDLRDIQDFEAVGRTESVTGSIDIADNVISAGSFEVVVADITSDDNRRDNAFTGDVMAVSEFPTATFTLAGPIELGDDPTSGQPVETSADGELTLRGTTNPVSATIQAQLLDDQIEVVGSIPVLFSDFGIENPSNPFVTVRDEGLVEVRLVLSKS